MEGAVPAMLRSFHLILRLEEVWELFKLGEPWLYLFFQRNHSVNCIVDEFEGVKPEAVNSVLTIKDKLESLRTKALVKGAERCLLKKIKW
jgi:hypothetical protein